MSDITKEMVVERLDLLQRQRADAQAQVHGFDGAIQDTKYWLQLLENEVKEDGAVPNPLKKNPLEPVSKKKRKKKK